MVHPSIIEPEPEPDIEGHTTNTPYNTDPPAAAPADAHDARPHDHHGTGIAFPAAQAAPPAPQPQPQRESSTLRTILKPRSRPGRARKPSITITTADALAGSGNNASEDQLDLAPPGYRFPPRSSSAPAIGAGGKNMLAPLKNLSIPLPPKMGPPPTDEEKVPRTFVEPTWKESFKNTIKSQPGLCAVPLMLPVSWALHFAHQSPVAIFCTSLIAIVPIAGGLGFATEEIAHRVGETWGGLLNATFGNAVELLIAILALVKGDIDIVQASMIGSILSNVLLVLGMSYFAGGLRFHEQLYTVLGAQMHISLLGISLMAIVLPAAFHYAYPSTSSVVTETRAGAAPEGEELQKLLQMSRGLSFILLAVYGMFLTFQLYTHAYLFRIPREKVQHPLPGPAPHHEHVFPLPHWGSSSSNSSSSSSSCSVRSGTGTHHTRFMRFHRFSVSSRGKEAREARRAALAAEAGEHEGHEADTEGETVGEHVANPVGLEGGILSEKFPEAVDATTTATTTAAVSAASPSRTWSNTDDAHTDARAHAHEHSLADAPDLAPGAALTRDPESQSISSTQNFFIDKNGQLHDQPKTKLYFAFGLLSLMTALAGVTAEWLVDSIDGLTSTGNVSREFVGLILLPVIGNSVEHITAVTVSVKDKLNLSMSIAVGSSIQVSLCLLPILVLIGWAIGQPMLLFFDTFETITLVISVLLVNFAISDGRTNYLEGFVMMMAYVSIALVCWFYDPQ